VQQLLVEGYAMRLRADRENKQLQDLTDRARELQPGHGAEGERSESATRTCPSCTQPLEWIENGRIGAASYDYYQWCLQGCGLYCYDLDAKVWVKLAATSTVADSASLWPSVQPPPPDETTISIVTDRAGYITAIDHAGAKLINYSRRHAVGTSLLPFVQEGRQELLEDLRQAGEVESPPRPVVVSPRDRKPRAASISICAAEGGIRWTIRAESVPAQTKRRRARAS